MLEARSLCFRYPGESRWVLENVSFTLAPGEIIGLEGPSGRGKSTLGKILTGYLCPERGTVQVDGNPLPVRGYCPVQMLFQHPELSMNPRWTIARILEESGTVSSGLLRALGIKPQWFSRYPHELSGGELQRVCLARVFASGACYVVCDEMTSMLDVLTQAEIWRAFLQICHERNIGLVVITHDQSLSEKLCQQRLLL